MAFGNRRLVVLALLSAGLPIVLSGCSTSFSPSLEEPTTSAIPAIHGTLFGGQQPVTGAHVYLYATGTSGLYSNSRSVLTSAVLSNSPGFSGIDGSLNYYVVSSATGSFAISGDYTCSTGESLYLYATGGNSGAGTGSNSHIGMLAALGTCASNSGDLASQVPSIQVNEVSTIATAYALAGFGHTATAIGSGSSAAAQQAMANAISNVPNVYNFATGVPRSSTPGSTASYTGTVPSNKMLWLADIIAACLNTDPNDSNSSCANLFAAMPNPFGGATTDTAQVALNMAHTQSPSAATISTLNNLIPAQPAFPYTSTAYTDLALPVVYTSPLQQPGDMAIDQNGYVWSFDYNYNAVPSTSTIYKLSPQGVGVSFLPNGGSAEFFNMAISPKDGSVWFYNQSGPEIDAYSNAGSLNFIANVSGGVPSAGGLAFNGSGNVFFNAGGSGTSFLEEDDYNGHYVTNSVALSTPYTAFVALDSSQNAWLAGLSKFYLLNSPYTTQTASFSNGGYYDPLVAGANAAMWYPDPNISQLDSISSSGAGITCSGGGMLGPQSITVDGAGHLWTGSYISSTTIYQRISGFNPLNGGSCTALTSSNGISNGVDPSLGAVPSFIAADSSGNIWTLNYGVSGGGSSYAISFTQFLGLSVPAVTPITPALVGTTPQ